MKTIIYVKAEKEVKLNAQKLARELGLSLSDVINGALRNFIRTREVTFSDIPVMTPELERILGGVEKDIKLRKNLSRGFTNGEEMDKYLDSAKRVKRR